MQVAPEIARNSAGSTFSNQCGIAKSASHQFEQLHCRQYGCDLSCNLDLSNRMTNCTDVNEGLMKLRLCAHLFPKLGPSGLFFTQYIWSVLGCPKSMYFLMPMSVTACMVDLGSFCSKETCACLLATKFKGWYHCLLEMHSVLKDRASGQQWLVGIGIPEHLDLGNFGTLQT